MCSVACLAHFWHFIAATPRFSHVPARVVSAILTGGVNLSRRANARCPGAEIVPGGHQIHLRALSASRRRPAGVALAAGAAADQRQLAALDARVAFVALEAGEADFFFEGDTSRRTPAVRR